MTLEQQNKKSAPSGFDAERLSALWQRKGVFRPGAGHATSRLSREEWLELARLVHAGLAGSQRLSDLGNAGYSKSDLINMFISDKVLRSGQANAPEHIGALRLYFLRYQRSLLRSGWGVKPVANASSCSCNEEELPDESETESNPRAEPFGERRASRVAGFFESLTHEQRALVAHVQCRDQSVLAVEQSYTIKSGAYQAKRLGIVLDATKPLGDWFRQSKLGQFIVEDLGVAVTRENAADLGQVFKLLCQAALSWLNRQPSLP